MNEVDSMDAKHLFLSKTFWFNLATLLVTVSGVLPAKYAPYVAGGGNVILRILFKFDILYIIVC